MEPWVFNEESVGGLLPRSLREWVLVVGFLDRQGRREPFCWTRVFQISAESRQNSEYVPSSPHIIISLSPRPSANAAWVTILSSNRQTDCASCTSHPSFFHQTSVFLNRPNYTLSGKPIALAEAQFRPSGRKWAGGSPCYC